VTFSLQTEVLSVKAEQVHKLAPSGHIKRHFMRFSQRAAEDCSILGRAPVLLETGSRRLEGS